MNSSMNHCYVCKRTGPLENHHVYKGPNRKISEKYGLKVKLCAMCHRGEKGVHGRDGHKLDLQLKREFQTLFEKDHSRDEFIKIIGRNYL